MYNIQLNFRKQPFFLLNTQKGEKPWTHPPDTVSYQQTVWPRACSLPSLCFLWKMGIIMNSSQGSSEDWMWIYEKYPAYRKCQCLLLLSFQVGGSMVKNLPASTGDLGDTGLTLGLRRSPGRGNGNTFQYSCLENCMDRGTWRITVQCPKESDMT